MRVTFPFAHALCVRIIILNEYSYPALKTKWLGVRLIKIGVEWPLDRRVDQSVCTVKTSTGGADR
jgi:hypothetical protein